MTETEPDKTLRGSNPVPDADAIATDADRLRIHELALDRSSAGGERSGSSFLRPRLLVPIGVVSCIAVVGILLLIGTGSGGSGGAEPAFAESAVRVAEANSRLLVGEPGWSVVRADQFEPDSGEVAFSDGTSYLQITWYPAKYYDRYRRDRAREPGPDIPVQVLGLEGLMIQYGQTTDFATMLPPSGPTFVEIRGDLGSEEAYREILDSLEQADVDTWLSAMPASVVQPTEREEIVDSMLEGVPVPPGFDLEEISSGETVSDRYQLGARVTGAVSCEWLDRYVAAERAGDQETADASVEAMSTSRDWPILQEMESQGGWSQVVWEISEELSAGELNTGVAGTETYPGGKVFEFGPAYATALGCDSEYHRPRTDGE